MLKFYFKLYQLLDARERRGAAYVACLMLLVALVEVLGVAAIMPFLAVLATPEVIHTNRWLAAAYNLLGFTNDRYFMFFLGTVTFGVVLGSIGMRALGTWMQLRFAHLRTHTWGCRLLSGYLRQPYEWFLTRQSAGLSASVLDEVDHVVSAALLPAMLAVAQSLVVALLLVLLFVVDPLLAFTLGSLFGLVYGGFLVLVRHRVRRVGQERFAARRRCFHLVQEAFGGMKDVKINGLESSYVKRFEQPSRTLAERQVSIGLLGQLPSYVTQSLLFGAMLLALLYLINRHGSFQHAVPIGALYAFAGYRLLPALQNAYHQITTLRSSEAALNSLHADMRAAPKVVAGDFEEPARKAGEVAIHRKIELKNVWYTYPGAARPSLQGLSLVIPARSTVGLVGATGSGKTTAVDLILGLLRPGHGALLVDGQEISGARLKAWQRSLGYVPQHIFLADGTIEANIAFGVPAEQIDRSAVEHAAKIANLHQFVVNELPKGYQTEVGDRGVRLSGGQRQRVAIARALYHDPQVLILDEATSALDNLTEQAMMAAVQSIGKAKTIIIIAHRLSTVRNSDCIYLLDRGWVAAAGTYSELVEGNEQFRALATTHERPG